MGFSTSDQAAALAAARSTDEMIAVARDIVAQSQHVALRPERLQELVPHAAAAKPVSWDWYLTGGGDSAPLNFMAIFRAFFDLSLNSSLNGGYFAKGDNGEVRQWELKGSGSSALVAWIGELSKDGKLPYVHLTPAQVQEQLPARLEGLPHAEKRLEICTQFAASDNAKALAMLLSSRVGTNDEIVLDMAFVDSLASIYTAGFGDDPFRKKAILAVSMLAGFLLTRGKSVRCTVPIPSDYQIPRILEWKGAIEVSDGLAATLRKGELLDVRSAEVQDFRAAALVAAHDLGKLAGTPDFLVDSALFTTFRKDPDFQANSLPPMKCDSLWF
jgi:hypothetical protein